MFPQAIVTPFKLVVHSLAAFPLDQALACTGFINDNNS